MGNSSSTPSCTITYREKHDVFLSFRGQDTRQGFTSHLYAGLRRKQIKTFIDYELERGDEISPVLLKAIEESKISVIIFSNDYASSKWCLDELVKILECKKMNGQIVIPVFYHVDPSNVRKQTKSFGDAFVKHEQDFGKDNDKKLKVKRWRTALTDASNLSGWDSSTARSEYELVEQIVKDILKKSRCSKKNKNLKKSNVRSVSSDFRHLVGIDSHVNCVKSLLFIGKSDFKIVGIWGMGGLEKTTIAKAVFDQISSEFGACHFFAHVRKESEIPNGLVHLREKVLSKILDEEYVVGTIDISEYIKDKLRRRKVLIVLDDVDNVDQIKILSEGIDQFGPGSRIIITTRNKQVLRNYSVNDIYDIKAFDDHESLQLFCIHAFKQDHPPNNYKEFAKVLENGVGTASAKVRDGASSLAKTSGSAKISDRAGFVESGESSMCRGSTSSDSTSSDVSDESTCSSFSSSVNKPHKANDARWVAIQAVRSKDGLLGVGHFRLLRKLGCGDIGSVYLSELSGTKCYFAMKVMDKVSLSKRKKLLRAQTEREILQSLDHPFLPTLYTHFETDKFSCLVMEFCPGGDLHALRQRQPGKHFSEQAVKFYIAEVLLAMEYLHMLGIVYRDLKPENVLLREDGHIMLSDFDLSLRCAVSPTVVKSSSNESESLQKNPVYCVQSACIQPSCIQPSCIAPTTCFGPRFFSSKSKKNEKSKNEMGNKVTPLQELIVEPTNARSMSFVGTHEYLAPEIIKGEGHGSAVDWWTFGIFLYELLFGKTPFKGSKNRATLFNVVGQPLRFPESPVVSFSARDLIKGLLVKEPQHRLAYRRGATEIKQHPFFQGVNWALIRCAIPPEIPKPVEIKHIPAPSPSTAA